MKYSEAHKKAVKEKRTSKVTPDYIEFKEEGREIVGQFVGASSVASTRDGNPYNQYLFHTDDGLIKFAVGSATDKEIMPLIKQGQVYSIKFLGKEKLDKTRSVNKFLVNHIELTDEELMELDRIEFNTVAEPAVGGSADKAF